MRCECGCDFEGVDEVTQFLIEEACFEAVEWAEAKAEHARQQEAEGMARVQAMRDRALEAMS